MATTYQEMDLLYAPAIAAERTADYARVYEANRHRVYSIAFWMTDNELTAEQVAAAAFVRAFAAAADPTAEMIDRALLAEVRELMPVSQFRQHVVGGHGKVASSYPYCSEARGKFRGSYPASGCFDGWARSKASSFMHAPKTALILG